MKRPLTLMDCSKAFPKAVEKGSCFSVQGVNLGSRKLLPE